MNAARSDSFGTMFMYQLVLAVLSVVFKRWRTVSALGLEGCIRAARGEAGIKHYSESTRKLLQLTDNFSC